MRIALGIEYNGHPFYGWQSQQNLPTVQGHLEQALSQVANEPVQVYCAGRTDAGVHGIGQVVHFDTKAERNARAWVLGTNSHLPSAIAVRWAQEVDDEFHARFSALSRRYRYVIFNHNVRSSLLMNRVTWHFYPLNVERMHQAAQYLLGEQDFSSFRSAQCESTTPMRNVHEINVIRNHSFVVIEVQANAFLHHMVRNIVGALLRVGQGETVPEWVQEVLHAKDRRLAAETAPPDGLYLLNVQYPNRYVFPESQNNVLFI